MNIFEEIHEDLPREGPGCSQSTRRAFESLQYLPPHPRILDLGCGPGRQTLVLAGLTDGQILAVDSHRPFLTRLEEQARESSLGTRIQTMKADMRALPFKDGSFDLIWAEGAIYLAGFETGLRAWRRFLKLGGQVAVSELTWLQDTVPDEARSYWAENYPAMQNTQENIRSVNRAGYQLVDWFVLPESAWWDDYYRPIQARINVLREKYWGNVEAIRQLDSEELEIKIFADYSQYYGYVFYVMHKAD